MAAVLLCSTAFAEETNKFKSEVEKQSYAIGQNIGGSFKAQDVDIDFDMLLRGIKEAKVGEHTMLSEAEVRETLTKLSMEIRNRMMEKQKKAAEKNKTDGEAFLTANKTKPGVISLPNGLQYKVITEGSGESPKAEDIIEAHYKGTLIDGTEFDSNLAPATPLSRAANQVIKGWTEAVTRMKPGAKWELYIPSELGYGERGFPPKIGPNATLIFQLELLGFKPAPPPPAAPATQPLTSDIIKVPSLEEMKKGAKIETIKADEVEKLQKQANEKKEPKKE